MRQRVKKAGTALVMVFAMVMTMLCIPAAKVQAAEKNASDVAALKAIIEEQRALGNSMEGAFEDSDQYNRCTWKDGRIVEISMTGPHFGSISFSGLPMLERIYIKSIATYEDYYDGDNIEDTRLRKLDVSKNTKLKYLEFEGGNIYITQLDLSNNKELLELKCVDCISLEKINISNCTKLTNLNLENTSLKKLDVSKYTNLTSLLCDGTQIKKLDVSKNTKLTKLSCGDTQIKKLDVSKNTELTKLSCGDTQIKKLDVSKNTKLTELYCSNTQIKKLNLKKCKKLETLFVNEDVKVIGYSGRINKYEWQ